MFPSVVEINLLIERKRVDFPDPEGPMMEINSPGRTERETSFKAQTPFP
jgi:hypothetical protein